MEYMILDDNASYAKTLHLNLNSQPQPIEESLEALKGNSLSEMATNIQKRIAVKTNSILFININLKAHKGTRQGDEGIELLKWLRLKEINNHCVAYSFIVPETLIKTNPLNCILYSKGVTYTQAPFVENNFTFKYDEIADKQNLLPFFRAEIDLSKIRHELANQYGYSKLLEVHKKVNPSFADSSKFESYSFYLLEYLFSSKNKIEQFRIPALEEIKNWIWEIKKNDPQVIYLDDKADLGWGKLLHDILGGTLLTIPIAPTDNCHTLFKKFRALQNHKPIDLFICDLKIKENEVNITDYTQLTSYKLVQLIRDNNGKQKFIYLTATNDLNKYKRILKSKKYNPQIIFTKEGADQMYTSFQSVANYTDFINSLYLLLKSEKTLSTVHSLQFFDELQAQDLINLNADIARAFKQITHPHSGFELFDFIIFDTNTFLQPHYSLELFNLIHKYPHKTIIHKSVYAEMKNMADESQSEKKPFVHAMACYFVKYFEEMNFEISEELMNSDEITTANSLKLEKDFADNFLVRLAQEKSKVNRILFVSNDRARGIRKGKHDNDGPIPILNQWIESTKNNNLKVSDLRTFIKEDEPFLAKTKLPNIYHQGSNAATLGNESLNHSKNERLKVKWKDCLFNEKDCTLLFKMQGGNEVIRIGKKHIPYFKKTFDIKSKSDEVLELIENREGGYNIFSLSNILIRPKTYS